MPKKEIDQQQVEEIEEIIRGGLPGTEVTSEPSGVLGDVLFLISDDGGVGTLLITWDRLQEDHVETGRFVQSLLARLARGTHWRLSPSGVEGAPPPTDRTA